MHARNPTHKAARASPHQPKRSRAALGSYGPYMRLWTACARGRALLPPSVGVGRRLLSSSLAFPSRLDPQLEKAISAFQKPKANLEAKTKALVDEFGMLQRV